MLACVVQQFDEVLGRTTRLLVRHAVERHATLELLREERYCFSDLALMFEQVQPPGFAFPPSDPLKNAITVDGYSFSFLYIFECLPTPPSPSLD